MPTKVNPQTIDPLWGYWVLAAEHLTDFDRQVLLDLYQPLLGSESISLYQLLWNQQRTLISERKQHAQLFNLLDLDAQSFYQARIKLEAVALMQTYKAQDALGEYLIYQLHIPLRPVKFFQDSILRTFLFEKIGQTDFSELRKKYQAPKLPQNQQITEITHHFLDVFHLSSSEILKESQATADDIQPPSLKYTASQLATFDWELLEQYIKSYHVNTSEIIDHQNELFNIHAFYGVTEIEMADLIANTLNVTNNQIDMQRLQNVAQKRFEERVNIKSHDEKNNIQKPDNFSDQTVLNELTPAEKQLVAQANRLSPADFLAVKKQQLGGFVGSSESGVLRRLQQRAVLPIPVINILVDYILNNSATLTQALVEKVANDWVQKKVQNAPEAIQMIKKHATKATTKASSKNYYRKYQPRQEQVTDWSKHQAQKVDPKELAKLQKRWLDSKKKSE